MQYITSGIMPAAIIALLVSVLAGCNRTNADSEATAPVDLGGATAESLSQVKVVRLDADSCRGGISSGLGERGFSVIRGEDEVDAVLAVSITHTGRNLDDVPSFGGVGNEASYSATLHGADEKVLFSTSGNEGSINMSELCGDIGDEIGERMQDQKFG